MNSGRWRRVLFVGPMVGLTKGYVTTQGLLLSRNFSAEGYETRAVSSVLNPAPRLLHMMWTVLTGRRFSILVLDVFGGRSFIGEDAVSLLAKIMGYKIVMVARGGAMPGFMAKHPSWSRRVLGRAGRIVVPSAYLKRTLEEYGLKPRVLPNMVSEKNYVFTCRKTAAPRLIWMRSFHEAWNPLMAVRVLKKVSETFPEASLIMAGQDKGLLAESRALASELGVGKNVEFPGFLGPEEKKREFQRADIFINTNNVDNMPVAVIEAWAAGLPVVATNVGGIPDMVDHGKTGLLVDSGGVESMAEAVVRLVKTPALAESLSAEGRKKAESFFWSNVRPQWEKIFSELEN